MSGCECHNFCENCGDCLDCYGEDDCIDGLPHYIDKRTAYQQALLKAVCEEIRTDEGTIIKIEYLN